MARVTVEDCIEKMPNRFDLVLIAAQRARNIHKGDEVSIDRNNDKPPVIALREIADDKIDTQSVEEDLIKSLQRMDEEEESKFADDETAQAIREDMTSNMIGISDVAYEKSGMQVGTSTEIESDAHGTDTGTGISEFDIEIGRES